MKYLLLIWAFMIGYSFNSFTIRRTRMLPIWKLSDNIVYFLEYIILAPFVVLIDLFYWTMALLQK